MDLGLTGKTALITGSTKGIGRAIATSLHREGAAVIINGRSQASVEKALGQWGTNEKVYGIAADIGTAEGCHQLLKRADEIGQVDILVNNAGIFEPKPFEEIPDEDWQKFYDVNVMSGVRLSRSLMSGMRERGWGRIVFLSSESAVNIPTEMVHYGMTKTAQLAVSRGLAKTLKDTGVTVNCVLPGPTWSEGVQKFVEDMAGDGDIEKTKSQFFNEARPGSLIQRFADVEEVANLVTYVCSQQAAATTGSAMRCDGGIVDTCF